jgi:hypothetical protein
MNVILLAIQEPLRESKFAAVYPASNAASKTKDLIYLVLNFDILVIFFSKFKIITTILFEMIELLYQ